jgi:hypothetical protein
MMALVAALAIASTLGSSQDLETAAGPPFSLERALASGPAILVFWNSWLPEADEFLPVLLEVDRAAAEHGWPGAIVVFQDEGGAWARRIGASGAALPRVLDRRGALLRQFKVTRAPSVVVVGRDGEVLDRCGPAVAQVRLLLRTLAERR